MLRLVAFTAGVLGWASGATSERRALSPHVHHFEPLSMDLRPHIANQRTRRDGSQEPITVEVSVFNRTLPLELIHVGASKVPITIVREGASINLDPASLPIYEGRVTGLKDAVVRGRIFDGVFEGSIHLDDDTIHFEKAAKFFGENAGFNTVAYMWSDVSFTDSRGRQICGEEAHNLLKTLRIEPKTPESQHGNTKFHEIVEGDERSGKRKYTRRATLSATQNTCLVKLVADQTFFASKGGETQAIAAMDYLLDRANAIYNTTDFFLSTQNQAVNLAPHSYLVYTDTGTNNPVPDVSLSVTNTLMAFSKPVWDDVCLAHLFVHREYADGVLGLAWVADPSANGNAGGICQKRVKSYNGELNLNTGLSSTMNYGSVVPEAVSIATVAHEIGHNFGSPHDPAGECSPGGTGGNYLMYAKATSGDRPNNQKFSPCSLESIRAVINTKAACFTEYPKAVCGNGRKENDEECDCGANCGPGSCCDSNCKIVGQCSPLVGSCCSNECKFLNETTTCRKEEGCLSAAKCTGTSGECPVSNPKPSGSTCGSGAFLCKSDGQCGSTAQDSVCKLYGATMCYLPKAQECTVGCNFGDGECKSTANTSVVPATVKPAYYPGGYSCGDSKGYCNGNGTCVPIENSDPVDVLRNFFSSTNIEKIAQVIRDNWYWFVSGAVVLIAIISVLSWQSRRLIPRMPPPNVAVVTQQPPGVGPPPRPEAPIPFNPSSAVAPGGIPGAVGGEPQVYREMTPDEEARKLNELYWENERRRQAEALDMYNRQHQERMGLANATSAPV
eukprot:comp22942_c0_seq1/m.36372 comp22942_c0_seq1/g.36372  ORF comp22942_c0_seq1/g.36372 comp22942_c0_seq1/m.36372 type:complete len:785 (-) comp22942_c0_seq1:158-2512(-)